jgi:hypothetical protein
VGSDVSKIHPPFQSPLLMVLLWNLTNYEINLQNLTLFLAKKNTFFVFLMEEMTKINLRKNTMEVFMEKEHSETKIETRGHLAHKRD